MNPDNSAESFRLIDAARIATANLPLLTFPEDADSEEPAWREDYLMRMGRSLLARGGDSGGTNSTLAHMRQRDYPVSTQEISEILAQAGFTTRVQRYNDSNEPLGPYVACCIARLD